MKLLTGLVAVALGAVVVLLLQNQDLGSRVEVLENSAKSIDASPTASPPEKQATDKVDALSTCMAQLHAQVVSLWNDGLLPPDGPFCKKHFYGLGPRVGD